MLTVSLRPVLEAEGQGEIGVVLEELGGKSVPPEVVAVVSPLLEPLVHLVDSVVWLRHWEGTSSWTKSEKIDHRGQ